jgi:flagellar hook-length control protein FliK
MLSVTQVTSLPALRSVPPGPVYGQGSASHKALDFLSFVLGHPMPDPGAGADAGNIGQRQDVVESDSSDPADPGSADPVPATAMPLDAAAPPPPGTAGALVTGDQGEGIAAVASPGGDDGGRSGGAAGETLARGSVTAPVWWTAGAGARLAPVAQSARADARGASDGPALPDPRLSPAEGLRSAESRSSAGGDRFGLSGIADPGTALQPLSGPTGSHVSPQPLPAPPPLAEAAQPQFAARGSDPAVSTATSAGAWAAGATMPPLPPGPRSAGALAKPAAEVRTSAKASPQQDGADPLPTRADPSRAAWTIGPWSGPAVPSGSALPGPTQAAPDPGAPDGPPRMTGAPGAAPQPASAAWGGLPPGTTPPAQGRQPLPSPAAVATPAPSPLPSLGAALAESGMPESSPIPPMSLPHPVAFGPGPAPAQTATQVATQVAAALPAGTTGAESELILSPPELGRVAIRYEADRPGGALILMIERPETLELMRRHVDSLDQALRQAGHEGVQIALGGRGGERPHQPPSAPPEAGAGPSDPPGLAAVPPAQTRTATAGGRLDLRL